jgi:hypothetical protein
MLGNLDPRNTVGNVLKNLTLHQTAEVGLAKNPIKTTDLHDAKNLLWGKFGGPSAFSCLINLRLALQEFCIRWSNIKRVEPGVINITRANQPSLPEHLPGEQTL